MLAYVFIPDSHLPVPGITFAHSGIQTWEGANRFVSAWVPRPFVAKSHVTADTDCEFGDDFNATVT